MHICYVCKRQLGPFLYWTSSRNFPRQQLIDKMGIKNKITKNDIYKNGHPVCPHCYNKLKAL